MATNPMKMARKYKNQLVEMDKRLAMGEEIPKQDFDKLIGQLRESSRQALVFGAAIPMLGAIGGMTSHRIDNMIKKAQDDVNNKDLYEIKNGMIKMIQKA